MCKLFANLSHNHDLFYYQNACTIDQENIKHIVIIILVVLFLNRAYCCSCISAFLALLPFFCWMWTQIFVCNTCVCLFGKFVFILFARFSRFRSFFVLVVVACAIVNSVGFLQFFALQRFEYYYFLVYEIAFEQTQFFFWYCYVFALHSLYIVLVSVVTSVKSAHARANTHMLAFIIKHISHPFHTILFCCWSGTDAGLVLFYIYFFFFGEWFRYQLHFCRFFANSEC